MDIINTKQSTESNVYMQYNVSFYICNREDYVFIILIIHFMLLHLLLFFVNN